MHDQRSRSIFAQGVEMVMTAIPQRDERWLAVGLAVTSLTLKFSWLYPADGGQKGKSRSRRGLVVSVPRLARLIGSVFPVAPSKSVA